MGGVLELGTTDSVSEDPILVNRVAAHFWELPFPASTCLEEPMSSSPSPTNETGDGADVDIMLAELVHSAVAPEERELGADVNIMLAELVHSAVAPEERELGADFVVVESVPDDDANLERVSMEIDELYGLCEELDVVRSLEDDSGSWLVEPAAGSFQLVPASFPDQAAPAAAANDVVSRTSCFVAWKRSDFSDEVAVLVAGGEYSQRLLKKTVGGGARMSTGRGSAARTEECSIKNHVLSERRRREKLNDMFFILKSMLPSIHKVDKASILAETIDYIKELKKRVEELESSSDEPSHRRRPTETSWGRRRHELAGSGNVSGGAKRIKSSSDQGGSARGDGDVERDRCRCALPPLQQLNYGGPSNVTVTVADKEVLLEVQCRWKELLMTRVFDAIKSLSLDVISVQASSPDGLLELKIRANKFAGSFGIVAPGMISEALWKAISS
ncbi:hypothetical protein GUJ93_ZPchr0326g22929 [Zizania palustris]|uniref:BHLH domain-containing protein n=1 Tax=Zizania palustris TaxID=103762 RepID=A0A8J5RAK1_ZIZPA|nr:hypothetical protein GUJ93_ZPchr0326g22929 [Zizania palustris]